jgi:hypothetical protein
MAEVTHQGGALSAGFATLSSQFTSSRENKREHRSQHCEIRNYPPLTCANELDTLPLFKRESSLYRYLTFLLSSRACILARQ